jgi:general secretion pathway protein G
MIPNPETPLIVPARRPEPELMRQNSQDDGFTLIELMAVLFIISVLVAIAVPQYKVAIIEAKEAVLAEDIHRMEDAIEQYYADKTQYPSSLNDLVTKGYLARIPIDPMTHQANWVEVPEDVKPDSPNAGTPGIVDVHSASDEESLGGVKYSDFK